MEEEVKNTEETVPETPKEPETEGAWFDLPSPSEDIAAAYTALLAVDSLDTGMIANRDEYDEKIMLIKMNSIDIIYEQIKYIKDCIISPDEPTEH